MAADIEAVEHLPDYPGSVTVKRLEGSLVAKRSNKSVPDHLVDTKIYSKVKRNGILQCKPAVIHFDGYRVGDVHQQTLRIINASKDNQQMHIIPPTTPYFSIKYHKQRNNLVPGLSLDVTVVFKPTKWQYYYDCVRVHCKGDQNLLIPIHAYPVMNSAQFPQSVTFPPTPLGQSKTKTLSLKCDVPIDFEFELSCLKNHPAFTVSPMKGIVSANSETAVQVTFSPTDFSTACMKMQLELSQFNSSPLVCTFTGNSTPGLAVDKLKADTGSLRIRHQPRRLPTLPTGKKQSKSSKVKPKPEKEELVYDGIHIPANIDTPYAVSKVLLQKPGKMKANTLKQVMSSGDQGGLVATRQVKEAAFIRRIREISMEERANQLRWVTQLGSVLKSDKEREQVLQTRAEETKSYKMLRHVALPEQESQRAVTETSYRRTRRPVNQTPASEPKFDTYSNDLWTKRHIALSRFVQAARKVVIRLRCQARLERLKRLASDIQAGRSIQESLANLNKDPYLISIAPLLPHSLDNLSLSLLPVYKETSVSALVNASSDGDSSQLAESKESCVHKDVPFVDLKVPEQWQLSRYLPQPVPAYGSYTHPDLPRPLRSGAQDELSSLGHIPGVDPSFLSPLTHPSTTPTIIEPPVAEDDGCVQDIETTAIGSLEVLSLTPPPSLFRSEPVHPLQLLNPCPGVATYLPVIDNSAITFDHVLKPLPAFPTAKYPQVRLDKMDVIPEVMQWKRFPNQYLVSTEGQRKLATHWKPQWNDPLKTDLLPAQANAASELQLMTGPQPDDFVDNESDSVIPVPTMDMVRAQFHLPPPKDQPRDPRLTAMAELEEERLEKFDQLGQKIRQKLNTFQNLIDVSKYS